MKPLGHASLLFLFALGAVFPKRVAGLELESHAFAGGGGRTRVGRFHLESSIGLPVAESEASVVGKLALRAGSWCQLTRWLDAPPVAGEDTIERRRGQPVQVAIGTLLKNDTATDRETLQFVAVDAVSAGGAIISRVGPWISYLPSPSSPDAAEDSFGYTIRDDVGAEATGTVRVRIATDPGDPLTALRVEIVAGPPAMVRVHFHGANGRTYEVQTLTDLLGPWTESGRLLAGADGAMVFVEPLATGPRFYRIVEPAAP